MTDLDLGDLQSQPGDGTHITTQQADAIETNMAGILRALDLAHWRVHVAADLPPEDARLMIEPVDGRRIAMLYVAETWWDSPAAVKRVDLTHEALHLAHHDVDANLRRFFNGSGDIADYVRSLVVDQFKTDLERMVDSLSYVIGPFMPEWDETGTEPETEPDLNQGEIETGPEPKPERNRNRTQTETEPDSDLKPDPNRNGNEPARTRIELERKPTRFG